MMRRNLDSPRLNSIRDAARHKSNRRCAAYGKRILATVSRELTDEFGKGFDEHNLRHMQAFYSTFSNWNAPRTELNWTHYRLLASQTNAAFECSSAPTGRPNHSPATVLKK